MIWWHKPGQKIRLKDGLAFSRRVPGEIGPQPGVTYTIRDVVITTPSVGVCFLLVEIINEKRQYNDGFAEVNFNCGSFVPLTDISDLEKLLVVKELEEV